MYKVKNTNTGKFLRDSANKVRTFEFIESAAKWAVFAEEMSAKQADPALNDLVAEKFEVVDCDEVI